MIRLPKELITLPVAARRTSDKRKVSQVPHLINRQQHAVHASKEAMDAQHSHLPRLHEPYPDTVQVAVAGVKVVVAAAGTMVLKGLEDCYVNAHPSLPKRQKRPRL